MINNFLTTLQWFIEKHCHFKFAKGINNDRVNINNYVWTTSYTEDLREKIKRIFYLQQMFMNQKSCMKRVIRKCNEKVLCDIDAVYHKIFLIIENFICIHFIFIIFFFRQTWKNWVIIKVGSCLLLFHYFKKKWVDFMRIKFFINPL